MIGLVAGCGLTGSEVGDPGTDFRVDQIEAASHGQPYFLSGELGRVAPIDDLSRAADALAGVLPAIAETIGVAASDLVATRTERDELGMTHVRMQQQKNGLPVLGGDVFVHIDREGTVRSVNSGARDRDLPATPSIGADEAARLAVKATEGQAQALGSELTYLVSNSDGELYLAWQIEVKGQSALQHDLVFVDALTGAVVDRHPQIFTLKNRIIRNGNGGVFPVANAPQIGSEGSPPTDLVGKAAYDNTGITYDCYKTLYNRDSYNNAGATMTSQVHVVFSDGAGGTSPNNAVWSAGNQMMAYGDGDGTLMRPLAYSLDVTAHELTHAVTSSTANLVYANESGALNEAMSDIMGAVCESWKDGAVSADTWLVGEDIWTPATAGDALRYMSNPTKDRTSPTSEFYSRDYYPERYTGTADGGGVHLNSGIPNLAFYLMSAGGQHPRARTTSKAPAIGIDKAGAIFQRALTTYMNQNTNMAQARTATEQAATDLYGTSCAKTAVSLAWATVGVGTAPTDTVAPTAAITAPASGARVSAGFEVQVNAADNVCVHKVELLIDGVVAKTLTQGPFNFTTDASITSGSRNIEVKVYDAFGLTSSATTTVNVSGGGGGGGGGAGDGTGGGNSSDDVVGGCAAGGGAATPGTLVLLLGTAFALRRRRARR